MNHLFRQASDISIDKICEDGGISHKTWEDIENGADSKCSTHRVYTDHLFENSHRVYNPLAVCKNIIPALLNNEYVYLQRLSRDASEKPPMSDCMFGFPGEGLSYSDEEVNEFFEDLQNLLNAEKERWKAEKKKGN